MASDITTMRNNQRTRRSQRFLPDVGGIFIRIKGIQKIVRTNLAQARGIPIQPTRKTSSDWLGTRRCPLLTREQIGIFREGFRIVGLMPVARKSSEPDQPLLEMKAMPWLIWVVGAAACGALILVVTHLSEEEDFLLLTEKIEPIWLGFALLLQSCTYVTQGIVWHLLARAMGHPLAAGKAYSLGLAMLFVDQALPSGGASGVAMVSGALSRLGMPRAAVASIVLMDVAMYYLAYASCMAVALGVALYQGYLPGWVNVAALQQNLWVNFGSGRSPSV